MRCEDTGSAFNNLYELLKRTNKNRDKIFLVLSHIKGESKSSCVRFSFSEVSGETRFSVRNGVKGKLQPQTLQGGQAKEYSRKRGRFNC